MTRLLACAVFALAQAPGPEFPSQVELVTLDVIVVDAKGQPVRDLTRDDFVVKEDGSAQEIVSFERFGSADDVLVEAPSPGSTEAAVAARTPHTGAVVAVIVDDEGLSLRESKDTRDAVARFVTAALRDGDSITIATTSGNAWWTTTLPEGREDVLAIAARLQGKTPDAALAFDHMSDYEAFAIRDREDSATLNRVVQRWTSTGACMIVQGRQDPGCPSRVRATAAAVDGNRRKRTQMLLATLRRTLESLVARRGRKSILLFSRGFLQDSDNTAREVAAAARAANAAVYFVDARGLVAQPGQYSAADPGVPNPSDFGRTGFEAGVLESSGTQALADETGGTSFRNTNDLGGAAARVAGESREYYLVGFHPRSDKDITAWRKLSVEVTRPGVTVRARKGYTLRAAMAERGRAETPAAGKPSEAMAAILDSGREATAIPVRARAFAFEPRPKALTRVVVAVEFDARPLSFEGSRAARVGLGVAVTHRDSGRTWESHEQVEVRLGPSEAAGWRSLAREFEVPAGVSQARVVLREPRAGTIGATSHRFEIPGPDGLRLTTPILTDRVDQGGGDHPRAVISIDRVFRPRGPLYCEFEVLGAKPDPRLRAPRVRAGVEVRRLAGEIVRKGEPTPIAPDARGRVLRLVGLGMDGLAEGDYVLRLDVHDDVSGQRVERTEPFALRNRPD
jgi:VWFA-related protein